MRFCEASAKDNFNVDEIFLKLVDDILSKVGVLSEVPDQNCEKSTLGVLVSCWTNFIMVTLFLTYIYSVYTLNDIWPITYLWADNLADTGMYICNKLLFISGCLSTDHSLYTHILWLLFWPNY